MLDLGCGVGSQAALLAARGAWVIGVDTDAELLAAARHRQIANTRFVRADLRSLPLQVKADAIWCSFTAAYFPDLAPLLPTWRERLVPGGWVALIDIDDLFALTPLSPSHLGTSSALPNGPWPRTVTILTLAAN